MHKVIVVNKFSDWFEQTGTVAEPIQDRDCQLVEVTLGRHRCWMYRRNLRSL